MQIRNKLLETNDCVVSRVLIWNTKINSKELQWSVSIKLQFEFCDNLESSTFDDKNITMLSKRRLDA